MALQLFKIASVEVATPQASIDFTSIPQGYTDLIIKCSLRDSGTNLSPYIQFNSLSTNLSSRWLSADGATPISSSNGTYLYLVASTNRSDYTANTFSSAEFYIPNYAGSNYKSVSIDGVTENNATTAVSAMGAGLWSSTAAITSLSIRSSGVTLAAGSTATLYGVL